MICKDVEARITAYLDGDLDDTTSSALRGHLRACPDCRVLAEDHARMAGVLAELPAAEPPAAMWDGVMARLAEAEATDARRSPMALAGRSLWQRLRAQLLPVTAVAAAATVALVWLATRDGEQPSRQRSPDGDRGLGTQEHRDPEPAPREVVTPRVDIEAALAAEAERIDRVYAATVAELLVDATEERADWAPSRQRRYDGELTRLRAAVEHQPFIGRGVRSSETDQEDDFDLQDQRAHAAEQRERAWQALIAFLQRAALGEMLAEARP